MIVDQILLYVSIYAAIIFHETESTVFFQKAAIPSSALTPGIKDYPYPVKLVRVTNTVAVPVPYPVPVTRKVPYPVTITKPVPYAVPHPIPVHITKPLLIRQAIPVPVVKPVVIPQPVFHPHHHLAAQGHHGYNSNYIDYIKNQAYADHGYQSYLPFVNNSDPGDPGHDEENPENATDQFEPQNDYANPYGHLDDGSPSRTISPPPVSSEYGSNEFTSVEGDSVDEGTANSQEVYRKDNMAVAESSDEIQGSSSQQDEDDTSGSQ